MDHLSSSWESLRALFQGHVFEFMVAAFLLGILVGAVAFRKKFKKE